MAAPARKKSTARTRARPARGRKPASKSRTPGPRKLREYNRRRDFALTAEPPGKASRSAGRSFVVQQHDATRMHYDFRLEHGGVLWSWAVPKGPSLDPADKRLAVQTEDHPVTYRDFEGHIPEGEYGGGPVIVWDRGTWRPDGDPIRGMRKGHLSFTLDGEKLHGRFDLVRLRGKVESGPKSNWLLFKRTDEHVRTGAAGQITQRMPKSVISGRTIAQAPDAQWHSNRSEAVGTEPAKPREAKLKPGARRSGKASMPELSRIDPQLATLVDRPPAGDGWVYEVKFDGYRMLASVDAKRVKLRSRNGLDWSQALAPIGTALTQLGVRQALFDGELCHVDADGRTSFQKLQNAMPRGKAEGAMSRSLSYFIFDLLHLDGEDLRPLPLLERKARLEALIGKSKWPLAYSSHLEGDGRTAFLHACKSGLEGLIAKRSAAPYREGRGKDWLKLKCQKRQEFVIVGMIRASGTRQGFRSLVIATRDGDGKLKYAGRVGTGFSQASLHDLSKRLAGLTTDDSPLADPPRLPGVVWVKPSLVCEVEYTEVTQDGSLRHPSFQGLREDKPAAQVRRERAQPLERVAPGPAKAANGSRKSSAREDHEADHDRVEGVRISHPERVIDETSGLTKLELARYHADIAEWLLPYARNRPLALVRCPDGAAQQCFFQKHVMPGIGPDVKRGRIGKHEVLYIHNAAGLVELAQFNVIELHGWGATMDRPDRPDWFVLDLDPDTEIPFSAVVEAAREVREALESIALKSWVKTTGGKGLHVCVPLEPRAGWDEVKEFTHGIARSLEARRPERYVSTMSKAKRKGKVFIDYLRNGEGATAVLPYSPRARPGATVAMPVDWKDIGRLDPKEFTVKTAAQWTRKRRKDPWADFLDSAQRLPKL